MSENVKLINVRMDEESLKIWDAICKDMGNIKRPAVIRVLLAEEAKRRGIKVKE